MSDLRHLLATYVHAHQTGNSVPPHIDAEARAALAAEPTFIASEPSDEDLEDLAEVFNGDPLPAMRRALELWGRSTVATLAAEPLAPAPADHVPDAGNMVAADGEWEELAQWLERIGDDYDDLYRSPSALIRPKLTRAAALLREARPQPVPVADRPWKRPGWCDAEGQCWWGRCADDFFSPEWTMATLASIEEFCSEAMPQHCLPHWAITIPQPPQGGEVEA